MKQLAFLLFLSLAVGIFARSPAEWRSRNIYQLLTDRYAKTNGATTPCGDFGNYCGGTFQGIINNLGYIQDMGFDAIWISPVILNTPGGYHGYWAKDIYTISPQFGGEQGLKALVKACHDRDIWVMVDVVANHMGPMTRSDFSDKVPFNDPSHYHANVDCSVVDPHSPQLETCWLAQLPDLNQDNDYVRDTLLKWINDFVDQYQIDGLRVDTVPYVSKSFWKEFTQSSNVYTVGEVFDGDMQYDSGYEGTVTSVLNYPLFYTLRSVFQQHNTMNYIQSYYSAANSIWQDMTLLGNFVDNHDNARFLYGSGDQIAFKSALAFTLTSVGIPITYYGSEQAYGGGPDPQNREPLWTNMKTKSPIYIFLQIINKFRKQAQLWNYAQVQRFSDDHFYAFSRGQHFFAFTNTQVDQERDITYHPYAEGVILCNLFFPSDCVTVKNGRFPVYLNGGEVKIFSPKGWNNSENLFEELEKKLEEQIKELKEQLRNEKERAQEDLLSLLVKTLEDQIQKLQHEIELENRTKTVEVDIKVEVDVLEIIN